MVARLAATALSALCLLGWGGAHAAGWLETRIEIEELATSQNFEAAFALGDEFLSQVEAEFGATSAELADAHLLLATLHREQASLDDAELHYLKAIEVLSMRDGELAIGLIEPLVSLGETYFESGQYELSLARFDEARAIGRRSYGLLNFEQIEIVDRMSVVYLSMGDFDQARDLQRAAVALVQRTSGKQSIEYVDAQIQLADWFVLNNEVEDARRVFLEIESMLREPFADDPLLKVRLLRTTAAALRNAIPRARSNRRSPDELEQALRIVEELDEPDPMLQAEILRDIGDWGVALSMGADIAQGYTNAWAILDSAESGSERQQEWFDPLTLINAPQFRSRMVVRDPGAPWGRVEIEFTVDTQGRARDILITQSDPPGLIDDAAIRQLMQSRFRPRMDNGRLIDSKAVVGWDFQYDPASVQTVSANAPALQP
jgi:tetratricopeptide (TPR) repeat protein